jgi:hypothetical protein
VTGWSGLGRLLAVDPRDAGCGHVRDVLHVYAEFLARGADAWARYPAVAAHLAACDPCARDLEGLLALLHGA